MAASPDPLARIPFLLHFTDERNLPSIRDRGGLFSTATLQKAQIKFHPGGDAASLALDAGAANGLPVSATWRTFLAMASENRKDFSSSS